VRYVRSRVDRRRSVALSANTTGQLQGSIPALAAGREPIAGKLGWEQISHRCF
jgi:hypothetical protein